MLLYPTPQSWREVGRAQALPGSPFQGPALRGPPTSLCSSLQDPPPTVYCPCLFVFSHTPSSMWRALRKEVAPQKLPLRGELLPTASPLGVSGIHG